MEYADWNGLNHFEQVKKHVELRILNPRKQKIGDRPSTKICDLAAVYSVIAGEKNRPCIRAEVTRKMLETWRISTKELHETAVSNMKASIVLNNLMEVIITILSDRIPENLLLREEFHPDGEFLILTNRRREYGAAVLAMPSILRQVTGILRDDLYLVPSSVHEVLVLPKHADWVQAVSERDLGEMVREINLSEVPPQDVLSDHIYEFSGKEGRVKTVQKSQRVQDMER